jgi:integrase
VLAICQRIEARAKTQGKVTGVQSQRTKTTISGAYSWAVGEGLAPENPCIGIARRSVTVARTRNPSGAELAALWTTAATPKGKLSRAISLIIRIAMITGQRRDEIAGCRVAELVDLDGVAPLWVIPGDVNIRGKIIEGRTKNGREQRLPLARQAVALFKDALADCSNGSEYVFPADFTKIKDGRPPRTPHIHGESVTMAMRRLRAIAGVDDVSVHDMRRAISNWMKDQGIGREVRDLALNHLDPSVDARHYSGSARMEVQVRAAMQAWADHIEQVLRAASVTAPSHLGSDLRAETS